MKLITKVVKLMNNRNHHLINNKRALGTLNLPEFDFKPNSYETLSRQKINEIHSQNLNPCLTTLYKEPPILVSGKMQYIWDDKGQRYLDLFGGIVTTSVGHCHPRLVSALKDQADKLWHTSSLYLYDEVHRYVAKLVEKFPVPLKNVFLCNSGSEANEFAVLLARLHTQAYEIISLRNCYHGCSPTTMTLGGISSWKYPIPSLPGIQHTTCPDPYRGRFGGSHCRDSLVQPARQCDCSSNQCQASDRYLEDLDDLLRSTVPKTKIAGFIAESIQGVGGFVQFPKSYLKQTYNRIKELGGVFIADEVQTGFGRLGTNYWGFESQEILPDIVTMAKGIGNGFPLAAVVTTNEIADSIRKALFFNTFGGNPLASRIGIEVLNIIDEENMQENSRILGDQLIMGLAKLRNNFPDVIGDVRGKGLMIGVELVKNKDTKEPISSEDFAIILENMKNHGLLVGRGGPFGTVLRITPPMCIKAADVDFTLQVFKQVFADYAAIK